MQGVIEWSIPSSWGGKQASCSDFCCSPGDLSAQVTRRVTCVAAVAAAVAVRRPMAVVFMVTNMGKNTILDKVVLETGEALGA
jgi:hypothetical protein